MNKDDYQNKIEEHRKPIQLNGDEKLITRTSRRSTNVAPKKKKEKRNLLLPILFLFFILIPVSFLIYVFAFYEPNANETTVLDETQVQYEQNEEDIASEEASVDTESEVSAEENTNTEDSEVTTEEQSPEESSKEEGTETEIVEEQTEQDTQTSEVEEQPEAEQPTSSNTHVVQPGETLYRIAMNYYNSPDAVEKIKSANGLSSNSISTGQTLILP
jgi:cytoskeletal protein RodZ